MILRERVSDNVYVFQSELYAQVNAGVVVGTDWAVAIDTLSSPEETLEIRDFIEQELQVPVRYVINTHYHADHSWGSCFFPGAIVISHKLCRDLLEERGKPSLEEARRQNSSFEKSRIVLPQMTFSAGELSLKVDKKTLTLIHLPGHSPDGIGVLIVEDRILYASDILMPLPYLVDGDIEDKINSYKKIRKMSLENVVQGHGEVILRGEVVDTIDSHLAYLSNIRKVVRQAARRKYAGDLLETCDVESCGKSRVLLGGLVVDLHQRNLMALFEQLIGKPPAFSSEEW
ncbi:MAG: MBL fold metallo-hydrolase [Anaerolineales bacterium]|nr:MBL fold metallo-hydrolase [Chloroflexota bacterium]MBL7164032.1 MBL fold metallo-hydrolase [Anaerolineales bacterium]